MKIYLSGGLADVAKVTPIHRLPNRDSLRRLFRRLIDHEGRRVLDAKSQTTAGVILNAPPTWPDGHRDVVLTYVDRNGDPVTADDFERARSQGNEVPIRVDQMTLRDPVATGDPR